MIEMRDSLIGTDKNSGIQYFKNEPLKPETNGVIFFLSFPIDTNEQ